MNIQWSMAQENQEVLAQRLDILVSLRTSGTVTYGREQTRIVGLLRGNSQETEKLTVCVNMQQDQLWVFHELRPRRCQTIWHKSEHQHANNKTRPSSLGVMWNTERTEERKRTLHGGSDGLQPTNNHNKTHNINLAMQNRTIFYHSWKITCSSAFSEDAAANMRTKQEPFLAILEHLMFFPRKENITGAKQRKISALRLVKRKHNTLAGEGRPTNQHKTITLCNWAHARKKKILW